MVKGWGSSSFTWSPETLQPSILQRRQNEKRSGLHAEHDGAEGDRLHAGGKQRSDLGGAEIAFRTDERRDLRAIFFPQAAEKLRQRNGAGLQRAETGRARSAAPMVPSSR